MFRSSLVLITVAGLSLSTFAQKTDTPLENAAAAVAGSRQSTRVDIGDINVKGEAKAPNAVGIIEDGSVSPLAAIDLSRDLLVAVQGNVDRERMERQNGESR